MSPVFIWHDNLPLYKCPRLKRICYLSWSMLLFIILDKIFTLHTSSLCHHRQHNLHSYGVPVMTSTDCGLGLCTHLRSNQPALSKSKLYQRAFSFLFIFKYLKFLHTLQIGPWNHLAFVCTRYNSMEWASTKWHLSPNGNWWPQS